MFKNLFSMFAVLLCFAGSLQAGDYDNVEIKVTPVNGTVYMLDGAGGNIGISAGADGVVMIDDQFAPLTDKILAAVKSISDKEILFVINTHWHHDHTGGNENFGALAHIIAHENVRKRMKAGQTIEFLGKEIAPAPDASLPQITYLHEQFIYLNGEEIEVTHKEHSHTDGDSVVYFRNANVLHTGDLFFNHRFPFVDISSGGSVQGVIKNIEQIVFDLKPGVKIIPGHGELATLEDLKEYYAMLTATAGIIKEEMKKGLSLEEIKAAKPLEEWAAWGGGFISTDAWIEIIYQSYKEEIALAAKENV